MKWIINVNINIDRLTLEGETNHIWAQAWDFDMRGRKGEWRRECYVRRDIFY
jgi:hypothetical protein